MERAMREKLVALAAEYDRLTQAMATQEVASDPEAYRKHAKAKSGLDDVVRAFRRYEEQETRLSGAEQMLREETDSEIRGLAEEERDSLIESLDNGEQDIRLLLLPKDPNDDKNTIVEIRAGTGGDEAGLFVSDLFRMYSRFAERKGWKIEVMNSHATGIGGYKEISFKVNGDSVYSQLKFEGGVHRVQRVPATETQGRIHTSTVTVAVLPEAEDVDIEVDAGDLQIDVYRSSGPGGQSVNTTDSAVRITHKPTGLVVTCQDEKSQHKNKARALLILRSRLLAAKQAEEAEKRSAARKGQVGTGERSEKIRTYNYPQNRLTDHRIGLTIHRLEYIMEGDLQDVVDALIEADRQAKLGET